MLQPGDEFRLPRTVRVTGGDSVSGHSWTEVYWSEEDGDYVEPDSPRSGVGTLFERNNGTASAGTVVEARFRATVDGEPTYEFSTAPDVAVARCDSSAPSSGLYPGRLVEDNGATWDVGMAVKLKPLNGEALAATTRYMARRAKFDSVGGAPVYHAVATCCGTPPLASCYCTEDAFCVTFPSSLGTKHASSYILQGYWDALANSTRQLTRVTPTGTPDGYCRWTWSWCDSVVCLTIGLAVDAAGAATLTVSASFFGSGVYPDETTGGTFSPSSSILCGDDTDFTLDSTLTRVRPPLGSESAITPGYVPDAFPSALTLSSGACPDPDPDPPQPDPPAACDCTAALCVTVPASTVTIGTGTDPGGVYAMTNPGNCQWTGLSSCSASRYARLDAFSDPATLLVAEVGGSGHQAVYTLALASFTCSGGTFSYLSSTGGTGWPSTLQVKAAGTCDAVDCGGGGGGICDCSVTGDMSVTITGGPAGFNSFDGTHTMTLTGSCIWTGTYVHGLRTYNLSLIESAGTWVFEVEWTGNVARWESSDLCATWTQTVDDYSAAGTIVMAQV